MGSAKSGNKTALQKVQEAISAQVLLVSEQDQAKIEKKINSGKFSILDRVKLTAMEGDSKILSKVMDKAIPNAGEKDVLPNLTINVVQFNARDKHPTQLQSSDKALPTGSVEKSSKIQILDLTPQGGKDSPSA